MYYDDGMQKKKQEKEKKLGFAKKPKTKGLSWVSHSPIHLIYSHCFPLQYTLETYQHLFYNASHAI